MPQPDLLRPMTFRDTLGTQGLDPGWGTLFLLSDDALALILQDLVDSKVDMAWLALLSCGFRQLARTVQFRKVTFDASLDCLNGILALLTSEAIERQQNREGPGRTQKPSLGACIRRVVVNHTFNGRRQLADEIVPRTEAYINPNLHLVIPSLPHLDTLQTCNVTLSQGLLNSLVGSRAGRVTLCGKATTICPRMTEGVCWPITSLAMELCADVPRTLGLQWENILRLCSPTLDQLTITQCCTNTLSFDSSLSFSKLTRLDIQWASSLDRSTVRSLLLKSKNIRNLSVDCSSEAIREVLTTPNEFSKLETLVVNYKPQSAKPGRRMSLSPTPRLKTFTFLENLPNLTSFAFTRVGPQVLWRQELLPALRHLHRLEKLFLVWDNTWLPEPMLGALSKNLNPHASLKELYLVIVRSDITVPLLDAHTMRVLQFPSLQRLVLSCIFPFSWDEAIGFAGSTHRQRRLGEEAEQFAKSYPGLEFVRLWGFSYDVVRDKDGVVRAEHSKKDFEFPFPGCFDRPCRGVPS